MDDELVIDDTTNVTEYATEIAEEKVARLEDANKKLFARAKTAEGFTQDSPGNWVKKSKAEQKISETVATPKPSEILKADEFKLYRQGYTETEIDLIMHNGGAKILEDEKNPLVLGLRAAKEQRGAEDAASKVTDSSGFSDIERKYTEQDLKNMSKEDLAKILPHVQK
jgi:hypothetical protein